MISKTSSECFVYVMLPKETQSVTAGKFILTQDRRGNPLGQFVYGNKYLSRSDAVEIDPIELKLGSTMYETTRLGGIFAALRDAGPDYWGRIVIEKHAGSVLLGELDYLLNSPDDRAGALGFGLNKEPPAPKRKYNQTIDLEKLQDLADTVIRNDIDKPDAMSVQIQELLLLGTSMGGARPKAVVEDDAGLWLAKFSRPDDRWNNPRVEHAMLVLASKCDITAARSRIATVAGKDILMVHRFDREKTDQGYFRARMISGLTLLRAEDSALQRNRWSYVFMAEEMRRVVAEPTKDVHELYRRMCFNALISNLDDHPRNHSLLALEKKWKLSPAYDLTPSPAISADRRDLAMTCGNSGRFANKENLLSQCTRFLLDRESAEKIISKMQTRVQDTWYKVVRSCGVSVADADMIRRAFVYEGFDN